MLRVLSYTILLFALMACGNNSDSETEEEEPVSISELTNIQVVSAKLNSNDFQAVEFALNPQDSTVRILMNRELVDSGRYFIDSSLFEIHLASQMLPVRYKPILDKGYLVELHEQNSKQILTVKSR